MISSLLPIETPEGISFSYEPASLMDRGKAYLIDLLIRIGVLLVLGLFFLLVLRPVVAAGVGLWLILAFLVEWGYYVLFEMVWDGQSPGKRLFNLRVIKSAGHPIGFYDSVLRNLLRAADALPVLPPSLPLSYGVGALSMIVSRRFQRLGDLAADTIVVHEKRAWFATQPPRAAALSVSPDLRRLTLSNQERRLLQEFVVRKDRLHPDRCEELAQILAEPYARRFGLPMPDGATAFLCRLYNSTLEEPKP
jgi:uncharacterized RDD family membrane protein YckC